MIQVREKVERKPAETFLLLVAALAGTVVQAWLSGVVGALIWNALIAPSSPGLQVDWRFIAGLWLVRQLVFGVRGDSEVEYLPTGKVITKMIGQAVLVPGILFVTLVFLQRLVA